MIKKTQNEFIEEVAKVNPYIEVLGEYINSKLKILVKDKRCNHKWEVVPSSILNGHACPKQECIQKRKNQVTSWTTNRLGEINYNSYGFKMTIIKYKNASDLNIKFDNGFIAEHRCYRDFEKGFVETPYDKSVCGIGYLGEGKYLSEINDKKSIYYSTWRNMLQRCYDEKIMKKQPTYKNVIVCDSWHNYQNFATWFDMNWYEIEGQKMALDKDILHKGNKIYSPETCIIVPQCINTLFVKNDANRGNLPIGVTEKKDKNENNYRARCNDILLNKCVHLGYHSTPKLAFNAYKHYKENHIKEVADYYREQIPIELYNAMYNYIVEITD